MDQIPAVLMVIGATAAAAEHSVIRNNRRWHPLMGCLFTLTVSAALWGLIFWVAFKITGLI